MGVLKVNQGNDSLKGTIAAHLTRKNLEADFRNKPWKLCPFFCLTFLEICLLITLTAYPYCKQFNDLLDCRFLS